jgi:diadenosine tetraphosphate (Ap4A) HIT family hydrolase
MNHNGHIANAHSNSPDECLACQIIKGEFEVPGGVIAENDWWVADHCLGPYGLGAVVVKSKVHRENLWQLTLEESASLGPFMADLSEAIAKALEAERVYVSLWVDQLPYHVHFVLQPRYPGKHELGLKGLELQVYRSLSHPPREDDMAAAAQRIRAFLQEKTRVEVGYKAQPERSSLT